MAKQLPKRDLENVGLGVTGACVALVTLVVAALIFMVAQKGLSAFLKDGVSVVEFFTGTKWDLANTAENGLPYTGALPLIVTNINLCHTYNCADDKQYKCLSLSKTIILISKCLIVYMHCCHYRRIEWLTLCQRQVNIIYHEASGNCKEQALYK